MLKIANVGKNDVVYDLGCGDGKIVIAAAQQFGARGVGIDIDPQRIKESNANAKKAGVTDRVQFILGDIFDPGGQVRRSDGRDALPAADAERKAGAAAAGGAQARHARWSRTASRWAPGSRTRARNSRRDNRSISGRPEALRSRSPMRPVRDKLMNTVRRHGRAGGPRCRCLAAVRAGSRSRPAAAAHARRHLGRRRRIRSSTAMLKMANVTKNDVVYDLGCGDGKIVIAAARLGARGVGIDIDPKRVEGSQRQRQGRRRERSRADHPRRHLRSEHQDRRGDRS